MKIRSVIRVTTVAVAAITLCMLSAAPALADWHIVAPGETLWQIGEQYGVDATDIAEANDIDESGTDSRW